MYQDFRGREIKVGSTIVYGVVRSGIVTMNEALVKEIVPFDGDAFKLKVEVTNTTGWRDIGAHTTIYAVDRVVVVE